MPVDPFQRFPLDLADGRPGSEDLDDLGLERADEAFGERIVPGMPDAAGRDVDPGLGQPLGVSDRQIVTAAVRVMDQFNRSPMGSFTDSLTLAPRERSPWSSRWKRASRRSFGQRRRWMRRIRKQSGGLFSRRMATWTMPCRLETQVKPLTHGWCGMFAMKARFTLSSGHCWAVSGLVVMTVLPRTTPCNPIAFISRSTVQRAMSRPSRR